LAMIPVDDLDAAADIAVKQAALKIK